MAASIIADGHATDTATVSRHLKTLTDALAKIQGECEEVETNANQALFEIEEALRNGLKIERNHLEKAEIVIERFDDIVAKLESASTRGWVSLQLLFGKLWRAPNGDLVDPNEDGAISEAIV